MSGIESQVLETFLKCLRANDEVSSAVAEGLRIYLGAQNLPKAEQLADLFALGSGDGLA